MVFKNEFMAGNVSTDFRSLHTFLKALKVINSECVLHIGPAGLEARVTDYENISYVHATLPLEEVYGHAALHVDLEDIMQVFRKYREAHDPNNPPVEISWMASHIPGRPWIYFEIGGPYAMKIRILAGDGNLRAEPRLMTFETGCDIEGCARQFLDALSQCGVIASAVRILVEVGHTVVFASKGDSEMASQIRVFPSLKGSAPAISKYSIDCLRELLSTFPEEIVKVSLGIYRPIVIDYNMDGLKVKYALAPRIETDPESEVWME